MAQQQKMSHFMTRTNNPNIRHHIQNFPQRMNQQNQQQFQQPQQFTKQAIDVVKDTEKLQNDQQRLTTLHSRLHKEAEKIRQWKTEKEIELKQKERSLSDAIQTIDSLRKSIIELQFQNEEFSSKLHNKEIEKEETEQKLGTVREIAQVLRDQMIHLENRISKAETDKDDLSDVNQKMINENQSLVLKFQELDINQATLIEKYSKQIRDMEEKQEEKIKDMDANIRHLENQIVSLIDTKTSQENTIKDYKEKLKENFAMIKTLKEKLGSYEEKLKHTEQVMQSQEDSLAQSNSTLQDFSQKFQECSQALSEVSEKLKLAEDEKENQKKHVAEVEGIYSKEINSLQTDLKDLGQTVQRQKGEIDQLLSKNDEWKAKFSQIQETYSSKCEENKNIESKIIQLEEYVTNLEEKNQCLNLKVPEYEDHIQKSDITIQELNVSFEKLQADLRCTNAEVVKITAIKDNLENEKTYLVQRIEMINAEKSGSENSVREHLEKISQLKAEVCEKTSKIEEVNQEIKQFEQLTVDLRHEKSKIEVELQDLRKSFEIKSKDCASHTNDLEESLKNIETLEIKLNEQEVELTILKEKEQEHAEALKTELEDKEKKAEDLGNKSKSLQSQLNIKVKQIKNLEKENKAVKTQLKKQTDKVEELDGENVKLQEDAAALNTKIQEMTKTQDSLKTELEVSKKSFDREQQDFCETLNQYKIETDKIVDAHIQEKFALKTQFEGINQKLKDDHENLRRQLAEAKAHIEDQKNLVDQLKHKVLTGDSKDQEICELEKKLSSVKTELIEERQKMTSLEETFKTQLQESEKQLSLKEDQLQKQEEEFQKEKAVMVDERQRLLLERDQIITNIKKSAEQKVAEKFVEHQVPSPVPPTTPKIPAGSNAAVTPQSILRNSQSNRGKRVLFTGLNSQSPMETEDVDDEMPVRRIPKTPHTIPRTPQVGMHNGKISGIVKPNIRFSPKPSPALVKELEEGDKKPEQRIKRIERSEKKSAVQKFKSTDLRCDARAESPKKTKNTAFNTTKSPIYRIQKTIDKKVSPELSKSNSLKTKMKKIIPKMRKSQDKKFDWFDL